MGDELPDLELQPFSYKTSKRKEAEERCVDSELWQACAGSTVKMPATNSLVYYFPQGHAEHAQCPSDDNLLSLMSKPSCSHVLCRVKSLKLMADPQTDEVFAKIRLVPIKSTNSRSDHLVEKEIRRNDDSPVEAAPATFWKTLTQSETEIGTSFTVPTQHAETLFPQLDYKKELPVQYIYCTDVYGVWWSFRHTYSGSPQRHLLSDGWSMFVMQKKLVAGDSLLFMKKNNGEIHVGIRRKNGGPDNHRWAPPSYDSTVRFRDSSSNNNMLGRISSRRIRMQQLVMEAMRQAWSGRTFEVEYYPRAGTPAYCVKASLVRKATMIQWWPGMIIKMAVESDDQSKISWGLGTVNEVGEQYQWRQLDVSWELEEQRKQLKGVKGVNPWMVEPVSRTFMPSLQFSAASFIPPPKRPCLQLPRLPLYSSSTMLPFISTGYQFQMPQQQQQQQGIQEFRHDGYSSLSPLSNLNEHTPSFRLRDNEVGKDDIACVLTLGVGHSAATANEQMCDVGTSGNDNDAGHDDALPQVQH